MRIDKIPCHGASWEVVNQTGALFLPLWPTLITVGWSWKNWTRTTSHVAAGRYAWIETGLRKDECQFRTPVGQTGSAEKRTVGKRNNIWVRTITTTGITLRTTIMAGLWRYLAADLMTNPSIIPDSVPAGSWLGMSDKWKLAGQLKAGTNYSQDFHLIHGRWK